MRIRTAVPAGWSSRPKILIYRDELLGGSETFILDQAESLTEFEPHYVGSVVVPDLATPPDRTHLVHGGGRFGRVRDLLFKATGFGAEVGSLAGLDPLLVHAHFGPDGVTAMPLARDLGVPMIVTFHGFDATVSDEYARRSFPRHRLYLKRRQALQRTGAMFLAVSDFIRNQIVAQGFPADRVRVHYTGIDVTRFSGDPAAPREPVVLFAGRLVEGKGGRDLIRAMAELSHTNPAVRLVVIGDGPERAGLEALGAERGVAAAFLGRRTHTEVRDWMRRASVFSVPSITAQSGWREGFGMVFAEALASGVPVVSYASGGIPEAVGDGIGGLLVPEGDHRQLADAIKRLLTDDALRIGLGQAGQARVRERFELRSQTKRLEAIYTDVVAGCHV
jgi:glycosyltransferase involved in cell wall biosynthesis